MACKAVAAFQAHIANPLGAPSTIRIIFPYWREVVTKELGRVSADSETFKDSLGKMSYTFTVEVNIATKESMVVVFDFAAVGKV